MNLVRRFVRGEYGLGATFWLGWITVTVVLYALLTLFYFMPWLMVSENAGFHVTWAVPRSWPVILIVYQALALLAISRSARRYTGPRILSIDAPAVAALAGLAGLFQLLPALNSALQDLLDIAV